VSGPASSDLDARLTGLLLGTAVGDALGLPCEGLSAEAIARRFGDLDRFRLCRTTGFVSDDSEQTALVAESLLNHPDDPEACARDFRRRLVCWFWRLPFGVGLATVRASLKATVGLRSGVASAGNGAAMRAGIIGAFFREHRERRRAFGKALALVTHEDARAVDAALFVAEVAALCAGDSMDRGSVREVVVQVQNRELRSGLEAAASLAESGAEPELAASELGTSGYSLHSVPFAFYCLMRFGDEPMEAIRTAIRVGGDTDSNAAIVGGWVGTLRGESALSESLIAGIHDGPFGPTHLRALARALAAKREGLEPRTPRYSAPAAMGRNLALYPVVLYHGFRRLLP
jgi:ADP-ribosylglycohydrolase